MDTTSVAPPVNATGPRRTRRGVLAAMAGLAGLMVSETTAKRRKTSRKPRGALKRTPSAEVAAAYWVAGGGSPGPGPGI
jgi:hypothetical protein